jgi:hypothetical protein
MGIEPTTSAWKAEVLPLNYTRTLFFKLYTSEAILSFPLPAAKRSQSVEATCSRFITFCTTAVSLLNCIRLMGFLLPLQNQVYLQSQLI